MSNVHSRLSTGHEQYTAPNLTTRVVRLSGQYQEEGGFATVYKCHYNSDAGVKEVAVKVFRFRLSMKNKKGGKDKANNAVRRELGIWKRVNHPNIVPFLGITYGFGKEGNVSLVSLWMTNGTIDTFLREYNDHLPGVYRLQLLLGISNGLSYLHSFCLHESVRQPIVHGDLTCNNVLLDDSYSARIVDFGFSSAMGDLPEAVKYLQKTTMGPGAVRWAAPEHFSVDYTERLTQSDIYSLGNIIFLVLSGKFPWSEVRQDNAVMVELHKGHKPARPESRPIENAHWALIEQCWASIDQRPPAEGVAALLGEFLDSHSTPQPLHVFLCGIQPLLGKASLSRGNTTSDFLGGEDGTTTFEDTLTHQSRSKEQEIQCEMIQSSPISSRRKLSEPTSEEPPTSMRQIETTAPAPVPDRLFHSDASSPQSPSNKDLPSSFTISSGISYSPNCEMLRESVDPQPPDAFYISLTTPKDSVITQKPEPNGHRHEEEMQSDVPYNIVCSGYAQPSETQEDAAISETSLQQSSTPKPSSFRHSNNESHLTTSDGDGSLFINVTHLLSPPCRDINSPILQQISLEESVARPETAVKAVSPPVGAGFPSQPTASSTWGSRTWSILSWLTGCIYGLLDFLINIILCTFYRPSARINLQIPAAQG